MDWAIRESVQAKMKMIIKRLLKKYGYPPDKTAKAIEIVMEQTKLKGKNESEEGSFIYRPTRGSIAIVDELKK